LREEISEERTAESQRMKGGPRSKLMEAVLLLLQGRPMRTSEIAANLGHETKYVSSYLSYWGRKGLVYVEGGRWHLSASGEELAKEIADALTNSRANEFIALAKQLIADKVKHTMNDKVSTKKAKNRKESLSFIEKKTNMPSKKLQKDMTVSECLAEIAEKLDEEERSLLKVLIDRYEQWGSTYVYSDQLQEELKADPAWLFKVLRRLQSKRILYLYHDPRLGLRIGFSNTVKNIVENC
jgi:Mn-dependent DtxR family transcriptional regulator